MILSIDTSERTAKESGGLEISLMASSFSNMIVILRLFEGSIPEIITNSSGTIRRDAIKRRTFSSFGRSNVLRSSPLMWNSTNSYPFSAV